MEITGEVKKKLPIESGVSKAGKQWQKLIFVLQKKGTKFEQEVALEVMNADVIQFINDTSLGTLLKCQIDVTSREYNGRYFTSATAWKAETVREESMEVKPHSGMQQMAQMHGEQYNRAKDVNSAEEDDSLPF